MIVTSSLREARLGRTSSRATALVLVVVACGGGAAEDTADPPNVTTAGAVATAAPTTTGTAPAATTPAVAAPATLAPAATTTSPPETPPAADPWALTEPIEIVIDWDCDGELIDRGGGMFVAACTSGRIEPWFMNANWFVSVRFVRDNDGIPVAIDGTAGGYSPHCMWIRALDSTLTRAPIVDGKAIVEGVVFGEGRCEGLRFVYQNTFDVESNMNVTSGVIELIP